MAVGFATPKRQLAPQIAALTPGMAALVGNSRQHSADPAILLSAYPLSIFQ
jgi:hypothetical protein